MTWTLQDAAHLLRRAGFGGSLGDIDSLFAAGRDGAIAKLLNYESTPDPVWDDPNPLGLADPLTSNGTTRHNLLYKLAVSARPLQSRLTWFWHGHFATSLEFTNAELIQRQIDTWRQHATANFLGFVLVMYKDGAMLQYLDGDRNRLGHPNENFSRENFELFTTGIGPYTEPDVRDAARAFTGYVVNSENSVSFNPAAHDAGPKTILGRTGNFNGDDVMAIAFARPETRRRVCTKLYQQFVSDRVNLVELNGLIRAWSAGGGDLKAVLSALLSSTGFWDPRNRGLLVKGALEYCIGLVQRLELEPTQEVIARIDERLPQMGQAFLEPPNPAGYPTGLRLTGATMLMSRYRFAYDAIYNTSPGGVTAVMTAGLLSNPTRDQLVSTLIQRLGLAVNPGSYTLSAVNDYVGAAPIDSTNLQTKSLGALYLLACSPEFQFV